MKTCIQTLLLLAFVSTFFVSAEAAVTRTWITDKLEVQLRAGPGNQYKVIKSLPSATELGLLEKTETNGYARVSLDSGEEGWISTRYLSSTPIARAQIEENSKKLADLLDEIQRLKKELADYKSGKELAEKSSQDLGTETARLNSEVTAIRQASANVLKIQNERDQLTQEKVSLENELTTLKRENQSLQASNKQDWFMIGAGVLFLGIILGLFIPRLSWRKKSNWNSF